MATRVYQLYGTTAVAANALTYWTAPRKGTIKRISWACLFTAGASGSTANAELSFGSGWQGNTNDALGPVDRVMYALEVLTAVGAYLQVIHKDTAVDLEVVPGDRLYLNVGAVTTTTCHYRILLEVDERGGG